MDRRIKDRTGQIWGSLKIIEPTEKRSGSSVIWKTICVKCNTIVLRSAITFKKNSTCGKTQCKLGLSVTDLHGKKFGKLTVISFFGVRKTKPSWKCECDCGNVKIMNTDSLVLNHTKSCGCITKQMRLKTPGEASWNARWYDHATGAINRNIKNELTKEEFIKISSQNCFYCDIAPNSWNRYLMENGSVKNRQISKEMVARAYININGIDRVNNSIGYAVNNSVPCCSNCNYAKRVHSFHEWLAFLERFQSGITERILEKATRFGINIPSTKEFDASY